MSPYLIPLLAALLCVARPVTADIRLDATTAHLTGPISAGQNRRLFDIVAGRTVSRLVITSGGGEVEAAIALGRWIYDHHIDVEVTEYCLSACANYVFPAGRNKRIRPGAVVAWHGNYTHLLETGLWRDDIAARMEHHGEDAATARTRAHAQAQRLARLEQAFFARIGVDGYLCWIGKMPPYSVPNYYFLSVPDMTRFGVNHVSAPPDYADTDVAGFEPHIVYIKLNDPGGATSR
jgi:hypothetical protein